MSCNIRRLRGVEPDAAEFVRLGASSSFGGTDMWQATLWNGLLAVGVVVMFAGVQPASAAEEGQPEKKGDRKAAQHRGESDKAKKHDKAKKREKDRPGREAGKQDPRGGKKQRGDRGRGHHAERPHGDKRKNVGGDRDRAHRRGAELGAGGPGLLFRHQSPERGNRYGPDDGEARGGDWHPRAGRMHMMHRRIVELHRNGRHEEARALTERMHRMLERLAREGGEGGETPGRPHMRPPHMTGPGMRGKAPGMKRRGMRGGRGPSPQEHFERRAEQLAGVAERLHEAGEHELAEAVERRLEHMHQMRARMKERREAHAEAERGDREEAGRPEARERRERAEAERRERMERRRERGEEAERREGRDQRGRRDRGEERRLDRLARAIERMERQLNAMEERIGDLREQRHGDERHEDADEDG